MSKNDRSSTKRREQELLNAERSRKDRRVRLVVALAILVALATTVVVSVISTKSRANQQIARSRRVPSLKDADASVERFRELCRKERYDEAILAGETACSDYNALLLADGKAVRPERGLKSHEITYRLSFLEVLGTVQLSHHRPAGACYTYASTGIPLVESARRKLTLVYSGLLIEQAYASLALGRSNDVSKTLSTLGSFLALYDQLQPKSASTYAAASECHCVRQWLQCFETRAVSSPEITHREAAYLSVLSQAILASWGDSIEFDSLNRFLSHPVTSQLQGFIDEDRATEESIRDDITRLDFSSILFHERLADSYESMGDVDRADEARRFVRDGCEALLRVFPRSRPEFYPLLFRYVGSSRQLTRLERPLDRARIRKYVTDASRFAEERKDYAPLRPENYSVLANCWGSLGDAPKAEHWLRRAIARGRDDRSGADQLWLAYMDMAFIALNHGNKPEAYKYLSLFQQSVKRDSGSMLINSLFYLAAEDYNRCCKEATCVFSNQVEACRAELPMMWSDRLSGYIAEMHGTTSILLAAAMEQGYPQGLVNEAANQSLCMKDLLVTGNRTLRLSKTDAPDIRSLRRDLARTRRDHSALVYSADIRSLKKARDLENTIIQQEQELRWHLRDGKLDWSPPDFRQVRAHLAPNEVCLSIVASENMRATTTPDGMMAYDGRYYCFVISPKKKLPLLIDLGPTEQMYSAVEGFRDCMAACAEKLNRREPLTSVDDSSLDRANISLSRLLWNKLELHVAEIKKTRGIRRVYLSLDGELDRLPFGALRSKTGEYLAKDYVFSYIASPGELVRRKTAERSSNNSAVIFANPDFGRIQITKSAKSQKNGATSGAGGADRPIGGLGQLLEFERTAGDMASACGYRGHWFWRRANAQIVPGKDASASNLLKVKSPRYLIMLTHGFFLPVGYGRSKLGSAILPPAAYHPGMSPEQFHPLPLDNPMDRSVICLAGANFAIHDGVENGSLMTAEAFSTIDLSGTELVVLGACESGMGGFDVAGLRSAVHIAGARQLVCSLWEVPVNSTCELLASFFRVYVSTRKHDAALALTEAQQAMISRRETSNPIYWAGFIADGL